MDHGVSGESSVEKSIQTLFNTREQFIVIGLTGKIGSGVSTVGEILKCKFSELCLPSPNTDKFSDNSDREYHILYEYGSKHWNQGFDMIKIRDIIMTFIVDSYTSDCSLNTLKKVIVNNRAFDEIVDENEFKKIVNIIEELKHGNSLLNDYIVMRKRRKKLFFQNEIENSAIESELDQTRNSKNAKFVPQDETLIAEIYKYCFLKLPEKTKILRKLLNSIEEGFFTSVFQAIGKNIRCSGNINEDIFNGISFFDIAERTNIFLKVYSDKISLDETRMLPKPIPRKRLIVIDSFKNYFEAKFFKDRYSAFYLISVNTDEETRKRRLNRKGYSNEKVYSVDVNECVEFNKKEYKKYNKFFDNMGEDDKIYFKHLKKHKDEFIFTSPDVLTCIQNADIHLYNPEIKDENNINLKKSILRYIVLMLYPGIIQPTSIERCMQIAFTAKINSGCLSRQVGAVVTDEKFNLISVGWNDVPEGQVSCSLRNINNLKNSYDKAAYSEFECSNLTFRKHLHKVIEQVEDKINNKDIDGVKLYKEDGTDKLNGRTISFCFKDFFMHMNKDRNQVHTRALHAEENAFLKISKFGGVGVENGILFTTSSPCELCTKKAFQLGISEIYYIEPYPGISEEHILLCGERRPLLKLFTGAIERAYTQLYSPVLPRKDELNLRLGLDLGNIDN